MTTPPESEAGGNRKLGIVGAGHVGRAIGRHWVHAGHSVVFGSRSPEPLASLVDELGPRAAATSLRAAAADGEIILLSVTHTALGEVLDEVRPLVAGKTIIDATNPVGVSPDGRIVSTLRVPGGCWTAAQLPDSTIVRAFSHIMHELLERRGAAQPLRWAGAIAGDDPDAKRIVADLVRDTGFTPVDLGGLADSAPLDPGGILFPSMMTEADMRARLAAGHRGRDLRLH